MNMPVDTNPKQTLCELGTRVLDGGEVSRQEAQWLLELEDRAQIFDLFSWANRIRERFKGNTIQLCSIVNIKAGGCPEDCHFCAQSVRYQTDSPRYNLIEDCAVEGAVKEAAQNGVAALGVVAAWRGLQPGPLLERVCAQIQLITRNGKVRADASLGLIQSQAVADKLRAAGLECYNHNLESSRSFFPRVCSSHSYDDRLKTLRHLKQAGIRICSGGIIGMGETREDRCALAFALRDAGADVVPINILNPIPGTPFGNLDPLPPLEALKTVACFRFVLPRQEIMFAGGRAVNLRDLQSLMFFAGASALMVGNYLTTLNQPVERDLQMLKDLGFFTLRSARARAGQA